MKKIILLTMSFAVFFTSCEKESYEPTPQELNALQSDEITSKVHVDNSVFVSSNTSGILTSFNIGTGLDNPTPRAFTLPYADADGIVYDEKRNALYHVNRSDYRLVALPNISSYVNGDAIIPSAMGPASFMQGREATMYNNKVVVADDQTPGQLKSYHVNIDNISGYREHQVNFEVWGIQVTDKDLWAIVDETNKVAYFQDFFKAQSGQLAATSMVAIEGLIRTHGLNYDEHSDIMVLTDIGDPTNGTDGGLIIITNFKSKVMIAGNGGTIPMIGQIRIYGPSTQLGNPVDVRLSVEKNAIFVAERKQDGGKFLIFEYPTSGGNIAPLSSTLVAGATAVEADF